MHRFLLYLFSAALVTTPLAAKDLVFHSKGGKATLMELYSSEGSSSCPPAEEWLSGFKDSPELWDDIFPVVFHVDYWDHLGWTDRFARPAYTRRQRDYGEQFRQDSVYTPEFIVNGSEWSAPLGSIKKTLPQIETQGSLTLAWVNDGKKVSAVYSSAAAASKTMYIFNVALLGMDIASAVERGENRGRTLVHDFVVLDFRSELMDGGPISTSAHTQLKANIGDDPAAMVAWVSAPDGTILQMTGGWLDPAASKEPAASSSGSGGM